MDNPTQHHEASVSSSVNTASLSSINMLFVDSWHVFTKSLLNLFLLSLLYVATWGVWFIGLTIFVITLSAGVLQPYLHGKMSTNSLSTLVGLLGGFSLVLLVGFLVLLIVFVTVMAAEMVVIDEYTQASVWRALKKGLRKVFPLIIVSIVTSLIIFGSFFLFIIPAILFALFFIFTSFELVISDNSIWGSIKRSTAIVMHNFGGVFVRLLLIWLLSLVVSVGMQWAIGYTIRGGAPMPVFVLAMIFNVLLGWYSMVYLITLYKQARAITPEDKKVSMIWILIVSLLGWLIFIGVLYAGYQALSHEPFKSMWAGMMHKNEQPVVKKTPLVYVPSVCGVEVALPNTKDTYKGQKRQWTYDEVSLSKDSFTALSPQAIVIQNPQATEVWYKNPAEKIIEKDTYLTFPGIDIMCVDNTRNLNFDTYKGLVFANSKVLVKDSTEKPFMTSGGVKLQFVRIMGKDGAGKSFEDTAFIGISKDGKKLMYIRMYATEKKDPKAKIIDQDREQIFETLRYGVTGNLPTPTLVPQQYVAPRPQQQTYVAPTIVPGALGSKEWQENFDKEYNAARAATGN